MGNFSDVFKAVFATTKTTATHLPVVTSAGAPDGIISTSDLASVLGVKHGIFVPTDSEKSVNLGPLRGLLLLYDYTDAGCYIYFVRSTSPIEVSVMSNPKLSVTRENGDIILTRTTDTNSRICWTYIATILSF